MVEEEEIPSERRNYLKWVRSSIIHNSISPSNSMDMDEQDWIAVTHRHKQITPIFADIIFSMYH